MRAKDRRYEFILKSKVSRMGRIIQTLKLVEGKSVLSNAVLNFGNEVALSAQSM